MKIALCLTGFLREKQYIVNFINFFKQINDKFDVESFDIYYSCPEFIKEPEEGNCENKEEKNEIINLFKSIENEKIKCFIEIRNYNDETIKMFKNKLTSLNIDKITHDLHSLRALSNLYGKCCSLKLLNGTKNNYDYVISARLDTLGFIDNIDTILNNSLNDTLTMYIWRIYPYRNNLHAEDGFFIFTPGCIDFLCKLYDDLHLLNLKNEDWGPEVILGKYVNSNSNITKLFLDGVVYNAPLYQRYLQYRGTIKYNEKYNEKCNSIYK